MPCLNFSQGSALQASQSHVGQQDREVCLACSHEEALVQDAGAWAEGCGSPSSSHAGELTAPQKPHEAEHNGQDGGEYYEGELSIMLVIACKAVYERNAAASVESKSVTAPAMSCPCDVQSSR